MKSNKLAEVLSLLSEDLSCSDIDTLDAYKDKVQNVIVNFISSEKDTDRQRDLLEQLKQYKPDSILEDGSQE